jgi:hypothetical protein
VDFEEVKKRRFDSNTDYIFKTAGICKTEQPKKIYKWMIGSSKYIGRYIITKTGKLLMQITEAVL